MTQKRILIIDDEASVRKIICDNLALSGFDVFAAGDGEEGLALIDAERPPGIIITDLIMPQKSGLDVIAEVRKLHPSVKIIAISGGGRIEAANDLLEKAQELGAHIALPKPLDLDALEQAIITLLGEAP